MKKMYEHTINKNYIYKGKILNLRRDDIILPNNNNSIREVVEHSGGAAVIAVDNENNVYLTKQYRYPYHKEIIEIPAGKLNKGEDPKLCAQRELKEETGLVAQNIKLIGEFYPSPGYTNEIIYIFAADNLSQQESALDEDEFLEIVKMPFKELFNKVINNEITDAKTVIATLWYNAFAR